MANNIYIETSKVKNIYIETSKVKKIYRNTTMIWQSAIPIARPTSSQLNPPAVNYDGSSHSNGFSMEHVEYVSGTTESINAGTFTANYRPVDGYCWEDTSDRAEVTVTLIINRIPVSGSKPSQSTVTVYANGDYQENGYTPPNGISTSGSSTGKDVGYYYAYYQPDINHTWSDGTTNQEQILLKICSFVKMGSNNYAQYQRIQDIHGTYTRTAFIDIKYRSAFSSYDSGSYDKIFTANETKTADYSAPSGSNAVISIESNSYRRSGSSAIYGLVEIAVTLDGYTKKSTSGSGRTTLSFNFDKDRCYLISSISIAHASDSAIKVTVNLTTASTP